MGGHLAIIGSREENDFVMNLALQGITRRGPLDGVWLGATDEHKEGAWEWVDGTNFFFTLWGPGQPNNKQNQEHYLLLFLPKNEWSGQPNESTQHVAYFVCEWDGGAIANSQGHEVTSASEDSAVARWVLSKAGRLTIEPSKAHCRTALLITISDFPSLPM
jgi:hypothetical protein